MKFQPHSAADEAHFEHRTAPSRACNRHLHRLRTVFRMPGDQNGALAQKLRGIEMILRSDLQYGVRWQAFQKHPPFDFGLYDITVHFVREVRMRRVHKISDLNTPEYPDLRFTVPGIRARHNPKMSPLGTAIHALSSSHNARLTIGLMAFQESPSIKTRDSSSRIARARTF